MHPTHAHNHPMLAPAVAVLATALVFAIAIASAASAAPSGGVSPDSAEKERQSEQQQPAEQPADDGSVSPQGGASPDSRVENKEAVEQAPIGRAKISKDGRTAIAPVDAPPEVVAAIRWANRITTKRYRYGGGHRSFRSSGYDCSGAVSYALRGARLVSSPLDSSSYMRWGKRGKGNWITVYTNPGHAYVVIAGLRFDTSSGGDRRTSGRGPRWRYTHRSSRGYRARHAPGL